MAGTPGKARCIVCAKEKSAVRCEGCLQIFCYNHLNDHRQQLIQQMDELEMKRDLFRQTLNEQINHPQQHSLRKQIDQWECSSIKRIQQAAKECRERISQYTNEQVHGVEINLTKLTDQMREVREDNDFNETDLNNLKLKLTKLENDLNQIHNVSIEEDSKPFINKISVVVYSGRMISTSSHISNNTKWKQNGVTIGGGNGQGHELNQLPAPFGTYVDDNDQCIYVADCNNHRIVQWKFGARIGQVVAGGNKQGSKMNQLDKPTDVIVDTKTDSLAICDYGNRRVVRWSRQNGVQGQTIIPNIACFHLAMDNNGDLYVSNYEKHEVRRWKTGEIDGTLMAGGNGKGNQLNQLDHPAYLFVDEDQSVYVSDHNNHRVVKWVKDAKEGIVAAGGQGKGKKLTQLSNPEGVIVDHLHNVYVADCDNHRIVRWSKGSKEGQIIVGQNGRGQQPNQLNSPSGLSFDRQGNLYVVDYHNNRIQQFPTDAN